MTFFPPSKNVAYDDGFESISYGDLEILTSRIALSLRASDLDLDSLVLLYLPSKLHFLFSWALIRLGVRSGSYNLAAESLDLGKVTVLTVHKAFNRSRHDTFYLTPKVLFEMTQFEEQQFQEERSWNAEIIAFSSGSTGEPKAMTFKYNQLTARAISSGEEVWTDKSPFMSLMGQGSIPGIHLKLWSVHKGLTYLAPGNPRHNFELIRKHKVKAIQASPNQLAELANYMKESQLSLPALELIKIAGGFASDKLLGQFGDKVEFWNTYASSEVGPATVKKGFDGKDGNVGKVVKGTQLEIVDPSDNPLPLGKQGSIRLKRDNMAKSYLGSSFEAFTDGWFYPGDEGFLNEKGELILIGRTDETRNLGGLKINLQQIDQKLADIEIVQEIAAFFYEGEYGVTQLGVACVPSKGFDLPKLMLEMRWRIGEKTPALVMQLPTLPRAENGKLLRQTLSESAGQ